MKRRVLLVVCVAAMLLVVFPAVAKNNFPTKLQAEINLWCQTYATRQDFLDHYSLRPLIPQDQEEKRGYNTIPSTMTCIDNGSVSIELCLEDENYTFNGILYPVVGKGYYDDKLILGDFCKSANYQIINFRIEKNANAEIVLRILVEQIESGIVYDFLSEFSSYQFEISHSFAMNSYYEMSKNHNTREIMQKTLSLMQIKNWSNSETEDDEETNRYGTPFYYDSVSTSSSGTFIPRAELNSFFSNMDTYGTTGFYYSPGSWMGGVLSQIGWKVYKNSGAYAPYFYVSYGIDNAGASRLVQLIFCGYSWAYNTNSGCVEEHLQVYGSVLVEWVPTYNDGTCVVVFYDGGPELNDTYLCASELAGNSTIFTKSELSFSLYNNQNPWLGFLISRIPQYGELITDIWNALQACSTSGSNTPWSLGYEVTVASQISAGGLIKDICGRSSTASLVCVGNYMHLEGKVSGTYYSHCLKFRFTAYKLL